ncbi:MAG: hypothetical protein IJB47_03970 [Oscillospiraceae bacterium]|nr:hypothetical protein [Oscillospiraceae bacterium]
MTMVFNALTSMVPAIDEGFGLVLGIIMSVLVVISLICIGFGILSYVLLSMGLYKIANRRQIRNSWLAWIPVGNMWILGSISDQYRYVAKGQIKNRRKVLLGLNIAIVALTVVCYVISFIGGIIAGLSQRPDLAAGQMGLAFLLVGAVWVVTIVEIVFLFIAYNDLYRSCNPEKADLFLVLSILFNVTISFFVFAVRNKDMGMPPRKQTPAPEIWSEVIPEEPDQAIIDVQPEEVNEE